MVIVIILAVLSGVSIVVSRMVNADLGARIGVQQSTWVNYVTGLALALVLLLVLPEQTAPLAVPHSFRESLMYFGGLMGVGIVSISSIVSLKMSAFIMTVLVFISQIVTAMALDYFLFGSLSVWQLVGSAVMMVGLAIYQRPDKKIAKE